MRITIDVTKRDITLGTDVDCPVTRAVRRALGVRKNSGMGDSLLVGLSTIYFLPDDGWSNVDLATIPKAAQDFVRDFDLDRTIAPFSFAANFNQARAKSVGLKLPAA